MGRNGKKRVNVEPSRAKQNKTSPTLEKVVSVDNPEPEVMSTIRVVLLGGIILATGALGFYNLPGMIADDAEGSRLVNSIYCSAITLTT